MFYMIYKEENMNKVEIHKGICDNMNYTYATKNADYGDSFARVRREEGPASILVRLKDKLYRLETILHGADIKVKDETVEDTLLDMANYCIMELTERKAEKLEKAVTTRELVYNIMCTGCPDAKKCHEECTECDEFTNTVELCEGMELEGVKE